MEPSFDGPLTACPLCSSAEFDAYDRDYRGIAIARCRSCHVLFMNPQYSDEYLSAYYSTYITESDPPERERFLLAQKEGHLELVERFIAPGRMLSIGSGSGEELAIAKRRGWTVEGYDIDQATTARVAKRLGVEVHSGDLFALPWETDAYDCVYLDQVLEHVKKPMDYLRLCHRILKPGGVLYLGVPNIRSLSSCLKTLQGKLGLKRTRGKHYDTWHHILYFSPATLPKLLERHYGFRVALVQGDSKPDFSGSLMASVRAALDRRIPQLDSSLVVLSRATK